MSISARALGLLTGMLVCVVCWSQGFLQNASFDVLPDSLALRTTNHACEIGVPESWVPGWKGFNGNSVEFEGHYVAVSTIPEGRLDDAWKRHCPSLKDKSCIQLEAKQGRGSIAWWIETELLEPLEHGRRYRIGLNLQLISAGWSQSFVQFVGPEHNGMPMISLGLSAKTNRIPDEKMGPNDPLTVPRYMNHPDEIAFDFTTDFNVATDSLVTGQWFHVDVLVEPTTTRRFLSLGSVELFSGGQAATYYVDNVTIELER